MKMNKILIILSFLGSVSCSLTPVSENKTKKEYQVETVENNYFECGFGSTWIDEKTGKTHSVSTQPRKKSQ